MRTVKILGLIMMVVILGYAIRSLFNIKQERISEDNLLILPTENEKKINVAIMADIHSDGEQLEKMLLKAKNRGSELVIIAGDLIDNEGKEDMVKMKNILDKSGLKYVVIPGDREKNLTNFKEIFGKDYQIIEIGKVKFILINNASWHGLGEEQKRWIEGGLGDCQEKICLAVMHKALNNLFSAQIMGEGNEKVAVEAEWLKQLFITSGVKRIEAADLHYSTSYELEGIRTDIVGAISRLDNLQSSRYTELMITKDKIERKVVEESDDTGN
ncbi:MAG TPA: metallophosphoesterase family protein [Candidatus Woesebacteria bacterium]|nr:metallophosphoesterase family protein [Candidatus Woesebacteria bacterium]